jgi:RHS repeat-associated protein
MANYTELYQYDSGGNITEVSHQLPTPFTAWSWTRKYQNDAASNRVLSTSLPGDSVGPPYSAIYQYDLNGNTVQMLHLPLMRWNYRNELQATSHQVVTEGATPEITYYVYDANGQRVRKVTESQVGRNPVLIRDRIYLGDYEIYRRYGSGTASPSLERQTLHVMDDKRRVVMFETKTIDPSASPGTFLQTTTRYQFDSHLGSAVLELDDNAAIISYEEYYPYGSTSYQAVDRAIEVSRKRYRYTGKERDRENGFYYHGARYYAPWLGRWTNCDPSAQQEKLNLYSYVSDRPALLVDPDGAQEKPVTVYHRTAVGMKGRTPRVDLTKEHGWGGMGFYGSSESRLFRAGKCL